MSVFIKILIRVCKELGLPEWAAWFVVVPILLAFAIGAVLIRRKYFQILKRKIAPYDGILRHGLFFWAPTAFFWVDGIQGELPWVSFFGTTRVRFNGVPAAGRVLVDSNPISGREIASSRSEAIRVDDRIFSARFQVLGAPGSFAQALLGDGETRKRIVALLQMSRSVLGRGEDATPKGRLRIEIDGNSMTLSLKGRLGTPEVEALLDHAAFLVRRVAALSDPASAAR